MTLHYYTIFFFRTGCGFFFNCVLHYFLFYTNKLIFFIQFHVLFQLLYFNFFSRIQRHQQCTKYYPGSYVPKIENLRLKYEVLPCHSIFIQLLHMIMYVSNSIIYCPIQQPSDSGTPLFQSFETIKARQNEEKLVLNIVVDEMSIRKLIEY